MNILSKVKTILAYVVGYFKGKADEIAAEERRMVRLERAYAEKKISNIDKWNNLRNQHGVPEAPKDKP